MTKKSLSSLLQSEFFSLDSDQPRRLLGKQEKTMKPFDMDKALKGDKVVTRRGEEVQQFTWLDCKRKSIVGVIDDELFTWYEDGTFLENEDSIFDLFMGSVKHEGWINIYEGRKIGAMHDSEQIAKSEQRQGEEVLATVKVEWEA